MASLKFLCEKKPQHSGESRKRKVPGLQPHKTSLTRARIEDFWVHYSRSTNLVSEQRRLSSGCQTHWNEVSELENSLIKPVRRHHLPSCESPEKRAVPGLGEETFRSLISGAARPLVAFQWLTDTLYWEVARLCPDSLWPHGLCSPPGSSLHGILQARILEWVAMSFYYGQDLFASCRSQLASAPSRLVLLTTNSSYISDRWKWSPLNHA